MIDVVEFLVDNTLGRQWYEMTRGQTKIVDTCEYLLHRPDEVFLAAGSLVDWGEGSNELNPMARWLTAADADQWPPFSADDAQPMIELAHCVNAYDRWDDFEYYDIQQHVLCERRYAGTRTQDLLDTLFWICRADRHGGYGDVYHEPWFVDACNEVRRRAIAGRASGMRFDDFLQRPKFVPYRPIHDPRKLTLRIPVAQAVQPLRRAFRLLLHIYEEAASWSWHDGRPNLFHPPALLRKKYADAAEYYAAAPRLIVEHNLRCVVDDAASSEAMHAMLTEETRAFWSRVDVSPASYDVGAALHVEHGAVDRATDVLMAEFLSGLHNERETSSLREMVSSTDDAAALSGELEQIAETYRKALAEGIL